MAKRAGEKARAAAPGLGTADAIATIAVGDVKAARRFYEEKLGLKAVDTEDGELVTYSSGDSRIFVYRSEFAGTNKATAATWIVDDVDGVVEGLKAKGVRFEHYDMPGMKLEGDVHFAGEMRAAWFKDPDGNILALVSG
jgi:catechol 2,3-dioxygenase-like lactoylglutathione lyase family enzyme